jgi:hypothetical protein
VNMQHQMPTRNSGSAETPLVSNRL